ncbi:MAG: polyphosphate kinase 2 family protein [Actinobacteria bacterium]|nr:polyphosphate kinase 2 family protein [Actinomycetota bacterium]
MAKKPVGQRWLAAPDKPFALKKIDPGATTGAPGNRTVTEDATEALRVRLVELQERLWAENQQSMLLVLQAMDAGGKDGTIRKVFSGVNPQGCRVRSFKEPSSEELDHDFLWRVHPHAPGKGEVAIFNRSHYEAVLVERVLDLAPKKTWKARYPIIRDFERGLAASGTRIVKVMLHISKDEQAERFSARLEDPAKRWKYNDGDETMRARWDDFMAAYADAISETSIPEAPWYVVPADHKWYRNWVVMSVLVDSLEQMNPQYPSSD